MALKRVVTSTMIGNGLEWYDYALYGNCAAIISQHFFPSGNPILSLIATLGVFAVGFLMRPLGAIMFGYIGDMYGRKQALYLSILLMAIPTACIGLLPTYESIGMAAPILLTLIRLLQGLAIGGEFGGSIVYLVEHAPAPARNRIGTVSIISMTLGILLGALISSLFSNILGEKEYMEWGWRIPFILGLFIGLIGLYIRSHLDESPEFEAAREQGALAKHPFREIYTKHKRVTLLTMGLYAGCTIPFYVICVFMNSLMIKFLSVPVQDAFIINSISLTIMAIFSYIGAYFCDIWSRNKTLILSNIGLMIFAIPSILMLETGNFVWMVLSQSIFAAIFGFNASTIATLLVDNFPTKIRYTGMSIAVNIAAATFGGTAPMLLAFLIAKTGMNMMAGFYVILAAILSLVCILLLEKDSKKIKRA